MEINTKQIKIEKTLNCKKIEEILSQYGEPLRWAIVKEENNNFIIEAVLIN